MCQLTTFLFCLLKGSSYGLYASGQALGFSCYGNETARVPDGGRECEAVEVVDLS